MAHFVIGWLRNTSYYLFGSGSSGLGQLSFCQNDESASSPFISPNAKPNMGALPDSFRTFNRSCTMEYVKLGRTGLDVSRLCLGCMSYGVPERGPHPWSLDNDAARPFIKQALDLGINFFDTANIYSDGTSEEIVVRALKDFARRDEIVLATKVTS